MNGLLIKTKGYLQQEEIIALNIYAPNEKPEQTKPEDIRKCDRDQVL